MQAKRIVKWVMISSRSNLKAMICTTPESREISAQVTESLQKFESLNFATQRKAKDRFFVEPTSTKASRRTKTAFFSPDLRKK